MATVELITLTDSLDERIKNGVETVTFFHPVFGTKHEIELGEQNRKHFLAHIEKLQKYIDASVEVTPEPVRVAAKAGPKSDLSKVRVWAKANGFEVGERGRIKPNILEAYDKAHTAEVKAEEPSQDNAEPVKLVEVSQDAPEAEQDSAEAHKLTDQEILNLMGDLDKAEEPVTVEALAEAAKV